MTTGLSLDSALGTYSPKRNRRLNNLRKFFQQRQDTASESAFKDLLDHELNLLNGKIPKSPKANRAEEAKKARTRGRISKILEEHLKKRPARDELVKRGI